MFGTILQHYKNGLGTTLNILWNAMDVSFQIVPFKFTFLGYLINYLGNFLLAHDSTDGVPMWELSQKRLINHKNSY